MKKKNSIIVVDPGTHIAELSAFNLLVEMSRLPMTYHLPAQFGFSSFDYAPEKPAGLIIFGSRASVNEDLPWQKPLNEKLLKWMNAKVPTLAICYGHQLVAHLFGGKVGFVNTEQKKLVGFRNVTLKKNKLWTKPMKGEVFISHCETVTKVPDCLSVVGHSDVIPNEAFAHKKLPVWSFQCHPEATKGFLKNAGDHSDDAIARLKFGHGLVKNFLDFVAKK